MSYPQTQPRYNYKDHGHDKYYGRRLFHAIDCGRDNQYRVKESILVRNEEGRLGHIGDGPIWAMNWMTDTGTCCFNPVKEDDLEWSPFHHCFFFKEQKEHFKFPIIVRQYYFLKEGKKWIGSFGEREWPELPQRNPYGG